MSNNPDGWSGVARTNRIWTSVMEDAFYEPENPRLRGRCRMSIIRPHRARAWYASRLATFYLLLGSAYRPPRAVKVKVYGLTCPWGVALVSLWYSRMLNGVVMVAAGSPDIVAEEAVFHNPMQLVVPVEQCQTVSRELAGRGVNILDVERKLSGSGESKAYICRILIDVGKEHRYTRSIA